MYKYLFFIFMMISSMTALSQETGMEDSFSLQPDTLFSSKEKCSCYKEGYVLRVHESTNYIVKKGCGDFTYTLLYTASDSMKIKLIEELLQFENDSSLACARVSNYSNRTKTYRDSIVSDTYTLQISALYNINMICFGEFGPFMYAPFPVLIDLETNEEINLDIDKIKEVFQIYKGWFENVRTNNFKSYKFPLFGSKYRWKFGDYSKCMIFDRLPVIKSDYKDRIGRVVN